MAGINYAFSDVPPLEVFEALCDTPEEAEFRHKLGMARLQSSQSVRD